MADLYVRHAMPAVRPDAETRDWALSAAGRVAADDLARRLVMGRPVRALVSSPEAKAVATAAPLASRFGLEVILDERLVEVQRGWVGESYRAVAHRYLEGAEQDGWETHPLVAARVGAAVADARARAGDGAVVVVGHGLSLSLHLEAALPAGFDTCGFWSRLAFPDAWQVDPVDLVLSRPVTHI